MLRGAPNFRDVGGLTAADGQMVRHGRVLRSGQLGQLHPEDVEQLRHWLGADVCVIDLRGARERARWPCTLPEAVVHSLPIEPTVVHQLDALVAAGEPLTESAACRLMSEAYRNFVRHGHMQLRAVFDHVTARAGRPVVVHCTAGKDRTGFMVAMLLAALGVGREPIVADYLLTNRHVVPRPSGRYPAPILRVLETVRTEYIEAAFEVIDRDFGGVDRYLQACAALTPERRAVLRRSLLTP